MRTEDLQALIGYRNRWLAVAAIEREEERGNA
jgi:hypothetical protein